MILEARLSDYFKKKGPHAFDNKSHFFKTEYHKKILHLDTNALIQALILMFKYSLFPSAYLKKTPEESEIRRFIETSEKVSIENPAKPEDQEADNHLIHHRRAAVYLLVSINKSDYFSPLNCKPNKCRVRHL